jgi:RNA polymerase sigma-70 factor (ECF subfamily)
VADLQALRRADLELAQRSLRGDEDAQAAIFDMHCRRVHRVAFRILGSNRDIDDVIQDTFLEIFRSLARYRGDAQLSTWIQSIAARVAMRVQVSDGNATLVEAST